MDVRNVLNDDQLERLSLVIPCNDYKKYFSANPREFNKIKAGYRTNKLTAMDIKELVKENKKSSFIYSFINDWCERNIEKIGKQINEKHNTNDSYTDTIAEELIDSHFANDIDLYLILSFTALSKEDIELIKKRIDYIKKSAMVKDVMETNDTANEEVRRMQEEIEELRSRIDYYKNQNEQLEKELNYEKLLSRYDEQNDVDNQKIVCSRDYMSICRTQEKTNGNYTMIRLADVLADGRVRPFDNIKSLESTERVRLFYKDGPKEPGAVGVWEWSEKENYNDKNRVWVDSVYNNEYFPIEIVQIRGCETSKDVAKQLKKGIKVNNISRRVIFATQKGITPISGVLCNYDQLSTIEDRIVIKEDVFQLPLYKLNSNEIVQTDDYSCYYSIFIRKPNGLVKMHSSMSTVKKIVEKRTSWNSFKSIGKSRNEWRCIRDFLENLETESLVEEIANTFLCSEEDAKKYCEEFVGEVEKYYNGTSFEDEIVLAVINGNEEMLQRCKMLIKEEWEKENFVLVESKNKELDSVNNEIRQVVSELEEKKQLLEKIETEIRGRFEIADNIDFEVKKRIERAKENVAKFYADMAFVEAGTSCGKRKNTSRYDVSEKMDEKELAINHTYKDTIDTIAIELSEAGVMNKLTYPLALILYAAYYNKVPVLLAGPNAIDIANAFSVGIHGTLTGNLYLENDCCSSLIESINNSGDKIISVHNVINENKIDKVEYLVNELNGYCYFIHACTEDLRIEPKSIYSYMIPMNTELLVDSFPKRNFIGGNKSENYQEYMRKKEINTIDRAMMKLQMNPMIKNSFENIVCDAKRMGDLSSGYEYLCLYLSYAQATSQVDTLREILMNANVSAEVKDIFKMIMGEDYV